MSEIPGMNMRWLSKSVSLALAASLACPSCAWRDGSDGAGRRMVVMLQHRHYSQVPYDSQLGERFLASYLDDLDENRLFFTKQDIVGFERKYADSLHTCLMDGRGMTVAADIHGVFRQRVEAKVADALAMLSRREFDFTIDETSPAGGDKSGWPASVRQSGERWRIHVKEAVLAEILARASPARGSGTGQAGPDAWAKAALRYRRLLDHVRYRDSGEIAAIFLSSVARTYDPHTDYLSFPEMNRFKDDMRNELVGIGALLQSASDGSVEIKGIVIGGPADREGALALNDAIIAVDSMNGGSPGDMTDVLFMELDKVVDMIRGLEGTFVRLKVRSPGVSGGNVRTVAIPRGRVEMKAGRASAGIVEKKQSNGEWRKMGWIRLPSFYADPDKRGSGCAADVEGLLKRLVDGGMDGLILDLRGNGGGSFDDAVAIAGLFIGRGPAVQVRGSSGRIRVEKTGRSIPVYQGPMVVVVDRRSASASEILAGALQDHNRAVVVGESSFGKGTVQQPLVIPDSPFGWPRSGRSGSLKVTVRKFYRPSGSSTQVMGVIPDIEVPGPYGASGIGEAHLKDPLPHDRIPPAAGFRPPARQALLLQELKELSRARIEASADFANLVGNLNGRRGRAALDEPRSLHLDKRRAEIIDAERRRKSSAALRSRRFQEMAAQDRATMRFFKLTVDDLEHGTGPRPFDPARDPDDHMRRAPDSIPELSENGAGWPSGLDPIKREALEVLADLVKFSRSPIIPPDVRNR
jgi:carboxyl-terminal processing protease